MFESKAELDNALADTDSTLIGLGGTAYAQMDAANWSNITSEIVLGRPLISVKGTV